MFDVQKLVRDNIKNLAPYSSARDEFSGTAKVFLDANENSFGSPLTKWYNRYPDPHQVAIKAALSKVKSVPAEKSATTSRFSVGSYTSRKFNRC